MADLKNYQKSARATYVRPDGEDKLVTLLLASGVSSEAGELLEKFKKLIWHKKDIPQYEIVLEIGDILWYLVMLCDNLGISLDWVIAANLDKLQGRSPAHYGAIAQEYFKERPQPEMADETVITSVATSDKAVVICWTDGGGNTKVATKGGIMVSGDIGGEWRPAVKDNGEPLTGVFYGVLFEDDYFCAVEAQGGGVWESKNGIEWHRSGRYIAGSTK